MVEIIDVTRSGEKVSAICRKANVGGDIVYQILEELMQLGFLQKVTTKDETLYKPTERGILSYDMLVRLGNFTTARNH